MLAAAVLPFPRVFRSAPADTNDPTPTTAWGYRHAARRLRCRLSHDRIGLHRALQQLAMRTDAAARSAEAAAPPPPSPHPSSSSRSARADRGPVVYVANARPSTSARRSAEPVVRVEARAVADRSPQDRPPHNSAVEPIDVAGTAAAVGASAATVERFADLVRAALGEGILRHARRQVLLGQGMRLGLGLFEANLVIAAVQHRHGHVGGRPSSTSAGADEGGDGLGGWSVSLVACAVVVAEVAAVAVAFAILRFG